MRNHSVRRLPTNECITWVLNEECSIEGPSTTNHIVHKNYIQFTEFLAHEALNTEELEPSRVLKLKDTNADPYTLANFL